MQVPTLHIASCIFILKVVNLLCMEAIRIIISGSRIWIKRGLNNVDLEFKLEINGNLLPIECDLMKK
jgi:hypothetical protein